MRYRRVIAPVRFLKFQNILDFARPVSRRSASGGSEPISLPLCQSNGANRMYTRRKFLVQSASSLALALGAARLAKAAVGGWAQQQGGSQDLQTGLVWLDYTLLTDGNIGSLPYFITTS